MTEQPNITQSKILDALRGIIDPDFNEDIVSLGFVKNVTIDGGKVSFDIELTTPACPVKDEFQRQAQEVVRKIEGVGEVTVSMTSQKRAQPAGLAPQSSLNQVRAVIAVSSCKGGVGKSTVAARLAREIAGRGFRVGLVDVDVHGPSIPSLFNLARTTVYLNERKQFIPVEQDYLKIMSFGFLLGDAPAVMRGPIVTQYVQQVLHNTAWGELDYLFIDMPPGTGDVQLTITQTARLSGAVIVTTPQTLSLIDVARGILMFEKVNVPILGLIENMAYLECDACHKRHEVFGKTAGQSLSDRFGIELLAEWPLMPQMQIPAGTGEAPLDCVAQAADKVVRALGKSTLHARQAPEVAFDREHVTLSWPDGRNWRVRNKDLRLSCRCALCVNEITGKKTLNESDVKEDIAAREVTPLGNYAIGVTWNDGHSSGIYPYKSIETLIL